MAGFIVGLHVTTPTQGNKIGQPIGLLDGVEAIERLHVMGMEFLCQTVFRGT